MLSQEKLLEALKTIANCLDDNNDHEIKAMEKENELLRQRKQELLTSISRPLSARKSLTLVQDMVLRKTTFNQAYLECKKNSIEQFKTRSIEVKNEISSWKKKLENVEDITTMPFHDVMDKMEELKKMTSENHSVTQELTAEETRLLKNLPTDSEEVEHKQFIEKLRSVAKEQRNLIKILKERRDSQNITK